MINRNGNGKLCINTLETDVFFSDLLDNCNTRKEVQFLIDTIAGCMALSAQDRLEEIGDEDLYDIEINL